MDNPHELCRNYSTKANIAPQTLGLEDAFWEGLVSGGRTASFREGTSSNGPGSIALLISQDCKGFNQEPFDVTTSCNEIMEPTPIEAKKVIPLMAEILHQLRLVVHPIIFKVFVHPRWCRISSINSMITHFEGFTSI